jgi:hypothetical protein
VDVDLLAGAAVADAQLRDAARGLQQLELV